MSDDTSGDDDRRSFTARTPANANPDRVTYRRGFVTRHQVTGWRFVMRRIASGVALHDTRMLVDPLRSQSRAVLMGVLILITGVIGCFVFSLIRPNGVAGDNAVLADRDTAALYVRVNEELHPVLNLTSARLIVGKAVNPVQVKSSELDKFPRGNVIGIPGAPERMVQSASRDADWTVCDGTGAAPQGVTVIAGAPAVGGERAANLSEGNAVLVNNGPASWLLWDGRRSAIDLADRAVTSALGFGVDISAAQPISAGLFNAIPESAPLAMPPIPAAGTPPQFPLPVPAPVGAVVVAYGADDALLYYAVLPDGLQPVSPVLAAILRNTDSYGLSQPPRLGADDIARMPVSRVIDTAAYPAQRLTLVDAQAAPVTCARWTKPVDAATSSLSLLSGSALPLADGVHTVDLVGGGQGGSAARVALAPGSGYFVQTVGQEPASPAAGSLFWVADTGVRYGIEAGSNPDDIDKTVAALGLTQPATPVPWSVLSLFSPGTALSKADALTAYAGTENR
ncbi:type VII secretion protein EccB [Mycolicibacterium komossense]|uniref:Type VII secretion protein EccB n=1 Tax=Mycolicibacterium komossense TaxID=1779 RepID=A0ABT3CFI4_9MYCO|nr:type VII secretion protein EccB [Mycolicibacterium komossense]MCV7228255.1 type VII secretion protein EccB [Mycolicibacterium komossense]